MKHLSEFLFLVTLGIALSVAEEAPSQCRIGAYTTRSINPRSYPNSVVTNPSFFNCQSYIPLTAGWYKFVPEQQNTDVLITISANRPSSTYRCNTRYPLYLSKGNLSSNAATKDVMPKNIYETKIVKLCQYSSASMTCLQHTGVEVAITHCGSFYVHKIDRLPPLCPNNFCYHELGRCPKGFSSITGFRPCEVEKVPCLPGSTSPTGFEPCSVDTTPVSVRAEFRASYKASCPEDDSVIERYAEEHFHVYKSAFCINTKDCDLYVLPELLCSSSGDVVLLRMQSSENFRTVTNLTTIQDTLTSKIRAQSVRYPLFMNFLFNQFDLEAPLRDTSSGNSEFGVTVKLVIKCPAGTQRLGMECV